MAKSGNIKTFKNKATNILPICILIFSCFQVIPGNYSIMNNALADINNYELLNFSPDLSAPNSTEPINGSAINDNTPIFKWDFKDNSTNQTAFIVVIDDQNDFVNIEYNSTEQNSSNHFWQFPENTSYSTISDGKWYWKVCSKNESGIWSNWSTNSSFEVDTKVPASLITYPVDYGIYQDLKKINGTASDPGGSGVVKVEICLWREDASRTEYWGGSSWYLNTEKWVVASGTEAWNYLTTSITWLVAYDYFIKVRASDKAGNTQTSYTSIGFHIDNYGPNTYLDFDFINYYWYRYLGSIGGSAEDEPFLNSAGVKEVNVTISGPGISNFTNNPTSYGWSVDTSKFNWLSGNIYTVSAYAVDQVGNTGGTASANFAIDTTVPTSNINNLLNNSVYKTIDYINGTSADSGGSGLKATTVSIKRLSDNYYWDGSSWSNLSAPPGWVDKDIWPFLWSTGKASWTFNAKSVTWTDNVSYLIRSKAHDNTYRDNWWDGNKEVPSYGKKIYIGNDTINKLLNVLIPLNNSFINTSIPFFKWNIQNITFSNQTAFHILIDDNFTFSNIDYDSGIQYSTNSSWQFPNGTSYTGISDGIWYFKIRLCNASGNWSDYSGFNKFVIDTMPPAIFSPVANPSGWTNCSPEITFSTMDNGSGVSRYEVDTDGTGFVIQTSPYTPPALSDGVHNITIRAYDNAGNYIDAFIEIYSDTTPPPGLTLSTSPAGWTQNIQPQLIFSTTDPTSGTSHYAVKIDSGDFINRTSPYTLPPQGEGVHTITVRAYDNAGNYYDKTINIYIDTTPPKVFSPVCNPSGWTSIEPEITFSTTDEISDIDRYEADSGSGFIPVTSPYTPALSDGVHQITIRAIDLAGNFIDGGVKVYIDRSGPSTFFFGINSNWSDNYKPHWVNTSRPEINFHANDTLSGIHHYEIKIDQNNYSEEVSPYVPPGNLSEGRHNVTLGAYDMVGNFNEEYFEIYIDTTPPEPFIPVIEPSIYSSDTTPEIEFSTTDFTSGIDHYEVSINDGVFTVRESKFTLPELNDGIHKITVRAFDFAFNHIDSAVNIFIDTIPPEVLYCKINKDALYTNSTTVSIEFDCSDAFTGCTEMAFSSDGYTWSAWEPLAFSKDINLGPGEGERRIYVKVRDRAGNEADFVFDSIIHDSTAPEKVNVTINQDAEFTAIPEIEMILNASDALSGIDKMSFSQNGDTWTAFEPYRNSKTLVLSGADGKKIVYMKITDKADNVAIVSDSITLDTTAPHSLSIQINNGSKTTNSTEVILYLDAVDDTSGIVEMAFSTDGSQWSVWEDYTTMKYFSLNTTEGIKTVHFKVKDRAGNVPDAVSASVEYVPPKSSEQPPENGTKPDIDKPDQDKETPNNDTAGSGGGTTDKSSTIAIIIATIAIIAVIIVIVIFLFHKKPEIYEGEDSGEETLDIEWDE